MISKTKKYLSLILSLVFLLALLPAGASAANVIAAGDCGAEGSNLTWTLDSDGVLTIEGTGAMADFDLPWSEEEPQHEVPWIEYLEDLTDIKISDSVTSIGNNAFSSCSSLTNVTLPDSVRSIGERAFCMCYELENISIPASVTFIGESAFAYTALTSAVIPASVTSISEETFAYCTGLTSVTLPDTVTSIGESAFCYCLALADMTLPKSLTSIGETAFYGCHSLDSVTISDSVASIGRGAFWNCSTLAEIAADPGNAYYCSIDGVLFNKDMTVLIQCPEKKTGACSIPASVTSIGYGAFSFSNSITDIYYGGTEAQWAAITIEEDEGYDSLANVTIHYNSLTPGSGEEAPAPPADAPVVQVSTQKLAVDGVEKDIEHYNIDGSNYFKLRDLACLLIGTYSAFDVGYDSETRTVTVTTGVDYTPLPTDLQIGSDQSASTVVSSQALAIDGKTVDLTAYNIGGSNYFMLRDLAPYLDFGVNYDAATRTAIIVTE